MIGELAAVGAAICWTISATLYRKALMSVKPISANILRCLCTGAFLIVCVVTIGKIGSLAHLPAYAVLLASLSGIIGLGFGDTLYMLSLKLIGVVRAVPITCTYPLFNILIAVLLRGEEITFYVVLGAFSIAAGIWLVSLEEKVRAGGLDRKTLVKGTIVALATAMIWSVSITMINTAVKLPETNSLDSALAVNTVRVSTIALALLAFSPVIDRKFTFLKAKKKTWITLASGGIIALALGWFFLTFSFLQTEEVRAVPISSTSPLFATIAGVIFLHEKVNMRIVAGSIVIVLGIFLIFAT